MLKIMVAAPTGFYPGCPIDATTETIKFFQADDVECWSSMDPADLDKCDAVIFPGGLPDMSPSYYGEENTGCHVVDEEMDRDQMVLIRRAVELRKPILGICRGHQMVCVYFGATLFQDIASGDLHCYEPGAPRFHNAHNIPGTDMYDIFGEITHINSAHHQALKDLPDCLSVSQLWCADPDKTAEYVALAQADQLRAGTDDCIIESVYHKSYPFIGLQWHPELGEELACEPTVSEKIPRLFRKLIEQAQAQD